LSGSGPAPGTSGAHSAFGVEALALAHRVEDAEVGRRIGAAAGAPLPALGVVGEVGVHQRVPEPARALLPGQAQVLGQQRGDDHAHPVVHPAAVPELAHAGVDDGDAGAPALPGRSRASASPLRQGKSAKRGLSGSRGLREVIEQLVAELAPAELAQIGARRGRRRTRGPIAAGVAGEVPGSGAGRSRRSAGAGESLLEVPGAAGSQPCPISSSMWVLTLRPRAERCSRPPGRRRRARGVAHGQVVQLLGDPGVVGLAQVEVGHVVFGVAVEAGGDHDQLRGEGVQPRQPVRLHGGAEGGAVGARRQRDVGDVGGGAVGAAAGVERVLEAGAEQHPLVAGEDVLGAVAVVDVEVDDGDALQAVLGHGVGGADGDVVEEAEAHGPVALGMVARRAHGAEGGVVLVAHDQIDAQAGGAGGAQGGVQGAAVHGGVAVDPGEHVGGLGRGVEDHVDIVGVVHAQQLFALALGAS
jgi:hypothetical protein